MHQDTTWPENRDELYSLLVKQMEVLVTGCPPISALSNASSLLWEALHDINWAGFYLLKGDTLYLGPFQGKTACTTIPVGRGVCGKAAAAKEVQLVTDVHQFPGHIACDSASNSEIVVPLLIDGQVIGVLDIDSPLFGRFTLEDAEGLSLIVCTLISHVEWGDGLL